MPDKSNNPFRFWEELKRRKVVRVITVYAAATFVILELVSIIVEPLRLPEWTLPFVIVLLSIGFIISVILSWVYDITPEGVQKTNSVIVKTQNEKPEKASGINGWKIATYISAIVIITLLVFNIINRKGIVDIDNLEKTIAILPFETLGQEDTITSLHDAIPIALILELQNINGFKVRPRGSSLKYKDTDLNSREIGEQLNANFLLKGYVQQQARNALIDIVFIKAATEEVIWNESFEMEIKDIFKVRREISKRVATSLKNSFIPEEKNLTENPDASMAFLTGLSYLWRDETHTNFLQSIVYFEKAVQLDPNFIQAYAQISEAHSVIYHFHYDRSEVRLQAARKAIETAKEINPKNPELIFAEGIYSYVTLDYETALRKFRSVEGQVFNNVYLNFYIGCLYRRQMNLDKAIEYYLEAVEADPRNSTFQLELGETNMLLRNYIEAERYFNKYILLGGNFDNSIVNNIYLYLLWDKGNIRSREAYKEIETLQGNRYTPKLTNHHVWIEMIDRKYDAALIALSTENSNSLDHQFIYKPRSLYYAEIYREQNNIELARAYYDSARIHLEEQIAVNPEDERYYSTLGIVYAGLDRKKEAIERGLTAISLMPLEKDFYRAIFRLEDLARIYTMVGEYDLALEQIGQLLSIPSLMSINLLKKDPVWEPLWNLPEFKQLIEKYSDN